jgi:SAM-dependent methyltransferase
VEERFKRETEGLIRSWAKYDRDTLRDYLVRDVEDPRINVQSILTRHFLIERLFGEQFADLMEHELRFGLVINWLLKVLKKSVRARQLQTVLDGLLAGEDEAVGLKVPRYISETFATLALPNYICDLLNWAPVETMNVPIPEYLMSTFQTVWHEVLENEQAQCISVLEPACGSANDYRFIDAYGIARLLDYTGFDLCEKNIFNAKQMFPEARFKVDNALEINEEDNAFDYCLVHDLFEHLSTEAMQVAIGEVCRVTRQDICVGFFNMHDGDEHIVRSIDDYHWNDLSVTKMKTIFERQASMVEVIHIDTFLLSHFGCGDAHNKGAYTFIIRI